MLVETPDEGGTELRRKVRVMNRGLRSALALGDALLPTRTGLYALEVIFHKILRRFVAFFLVALLAASFVLAASSAGWWILLGAQLAFYGLAAAGRAARRHALGPAEATLDPLLLLPRQRRGGARRAVAGSAASASTPGSPRCARPSSA